MPREELNSSHVEWSRRHFGMMANHGTWAVPRSGLIFTKTDENTLTLTARMPWNEGIAHSAQLGADVPKTSKSWRATNNPTTRSSHPTSGLRASRSNPT